MLILRRRHVDDDLVSLACNIGVHKFRSKTLVDAHLTLFKVLLFSSSTTFKLQKKFPRIRDELAVYIKFSDMSQIMFKTIRTPNPSTKTPPSSVEAKLLQVTGVSGRMNTSYLSLKILITMCFIDNTNLLCYKPKDQF